MKIVTDISALKRKRRPIWMAIGFFDGLHRGHQKVLDKTRKLAEEEGGEAWLLTFDPHPLKVLRSDIAPPLLTSLEHKLNLLRRFGLHGCLVLPFTTDFAHLSPAAFLDLLRANVPALRGLLVGQNWRFGNHQSGSTRALSRLVRARGIRLSIVPSVRFNHETISSTRIRKAIQSGKLSASARMLGRPFSVLGTVVSGDHMGRKLGFRTANLDITNEALPPQGVYIVEARLGSTVHRGIASLGPRSTFHHAPDAPVILEVHLLEYSGTLYGQAIELSFLERIRDQRHFPSPDALKHAIENDRQHALKVFLKK